MTIPASKVKAICTDSEIALVRASRKPELEQLSHAEVKRLAVRARKLFEKWQDLDRSQSRNVSQKVGFGDTSANTQLKVELFRDTLQSLEARSKKLDGSGAVAAKKAGPKTKKTRNLEHRATRAEVRKGIAAKKDLLNAGKRTKKLQLAAAPVVSPLSKQAPAQSTAVVTAPDKPATKAQPAKQAAAKMQRSASGTPKSRKPASVFSPAKLRVDGFVFSPTKQRKATSAAKQSRVVRSGKTTRMIGHITARGKRVQARRDAKN